MTASQTRPIFSIAQRLVQMWSTIEQELAQLRVLRLRRERVCAYLRTPGCNLVLGTAHLQRIDEARREHIARLRVCRCDAWTLVADLNRQPAPNASTSDMSPSRSAHDSPALGTRRPRVRWIAS
jgi:hypothetical protein